MSPAVGIEGRGSAIAPEPDGSVLVSYAGKRDTLPHVQTSLKQTLMESFMAAHDSM